MKLSEISKQTIPITSGQPMKLSQIVANNAPQSIWQKLGAEVTSEMQAAHPYLSTAAMTAQDIATIPYAFFNQMAMNYPRRLLEEKAGVTVPQAETKTARALSNVAGVVGGFKNPIFRAFGGAKGFLEAPLRAKALIGGAQAAAYPTQKGIFNIAEKPGQFAQGAALGTVIPLAGKTLSVAGQEIKRIPGAPEWLARNISGVTDFTKKTVSRLGAKVFQPEYYADDYVGRVFTPKFRENIFSQIEKLNPGWENAAKLAKFKTNEIDALRAMSRSSRTSFVDLMRSGMTAQEAAKEVLGDAGKVMDNVIVSHNKPIPINNTINSIKRNLLQFKWATLDNKGNLVPNRVTSVPHTTRDVLIELHDFFKKPVGTALQAGGKTTTARSFTNAGDWQYARNRMEALFTGEAANDKVVGNIIRTFVNDAKGGAGIPGYKDAAQRWADARVLQKLAPRIEALTEPKKINSVFAGINANNAGDKYTFIQEIEKAVPKSLYEDLAAHYASKNFDPTFHPSRAGFLKTLTEKLSKEYYKKYPQGMHLPAKFKAATGAIKAITAPPAKAIGRGVSQILEEPYFSPGTKAGAQALLKGRRGSVLIPGGGAAGQPPFRKR